MVDGGLFLLFIFFWFLVLFDVLIFFFTALLRTIHTVHTRFFFFSILDALGVKVAEWEPNKAHVNHKNVAYEIQIINC